MKSHKTTTIEWFAPHDENHRGGPSLGQRLLIRGSHRDKGSGVWPGSISYDGIDRVWSCDDGYEVIHVTEWALMPE